MEMSSQLHNPASQPLYVPGKSFQNFGWEVGWAPESVWMLRRRENLILMPKYFILQTLRAAYPVL
jgi:hypothetical protein